jgi:mitochondrial import receptor subunit TOM40
LFDGARADIAKMLSPNFQVTHTFSAGSAMLPASYMFNAVYMDDELFLQGTLEMDGSIQGRVHRMLSKALTLKCNTQLTSKQELCMFQGEIDYQGDDYSLNFKAINPWIEGTGVIVGGYLQSVTERLALGVECIIQRPTIHHEQTQLSLIGRYKEDNSITTVHMQGPASGIASYWHRVNEKVEVGAELQLTATASRREALCTLGAKFDFHQATLRTQADTSGRVSILLEEKLFPGFTFMVAGDLDHMKVCIPIQHRRQECARDNRTLTNLTLFIGPKQIWCWFYARELSLCVRLNVDEWILVKRHSIDKNYCSLPASN